MNAVKEDSVVAAAAWEAGEAGEAVRKDYGDTVSIDSSYKQIKGKEEAEGENKDFKQEEKNKRSENEKSENTKGTGRRAETREGNKSRK